MSDRLQELIVFVRAAESGSFSQAARSLNLSQPSVSRIVSELEGRLGVKLLLRTARRVTPTETGIGLLDRARQRLADLEAAEEAARGIDSLNGTIRIALPVTFGTREVIPRLSAFLEAHPRLRLDLVMSDDRQDLVAEGIDVAIRLGSLAASGFGARRLASSRRFLIAAPAYLAARGEPRSPADLAGHACIVGPGVAARPSWAFSGERGAVTIEPDARIACTSGEGVMAFIRAGMGVGVASEWMCRPDLDAGSVVPTMTDYGLAPIEVHAVFPGGPRPSTKVRALVDHLARELSQAKARRDQAGRST